MRDDLLEHLEMKHTQNFRCDVCHMKADSNMQLRKHKTVCNLKSNQPKEVCPFWRKGMCRFDEKNCKFLHPPQPKCRNQKNCIFWPQCKYAHDDMRCRFQERCWNQNCEFSHKDFSMEIQFQENF